MKDELMRRISVALDSPDGLASDPALQEELRGDPEATKYTKDVARVGKWLAVWPLPEPDDDAFEALASRIEQRLDEALPAIADPTAPPTFDDDDAIRDAAASLLQSGEFRVSEPAIETRASDPGMELSPSDPELEMREVSNPEALAIAAPAAAAAAPPSEPKPISPIAKVSLNKSRAPSIVEEVSSPGTGEPLSAAELELRIGTQPKKKKKKKHAPAAATAQSSDRISIPTPKPALGAAPTLSPVVQLPKAEEKTSPGSFWWLAAAAAVGLGVFGAATLFESQAAPSAESAQGSTLVTTGSIAPTASSPTLAAAPVAPVVAPAPPPATGLAVAVPPATMVAPPPMEEPDLEDPYADLAGPRARVAARPSTAPAAPYYAPARVAAPAHASGGAGRVDDVFAAADSVEEAARSRRAGTGTSAGSSVGAGASTRSDPAPAATPTPTTPTTSTATTGAAAEAAPPPPATHAATSTTSAPEPSADADLPATPDRATIQAVLEGRLAAVTACTEGAHGLADVDIVIASSGRITTATVNGPFAGTPIGSCIARAVRAARFPAFSQPRFEVTYPYHL